MSDVKQVLNTAVAGSTSSMRDQSAAGLILQAHCLSVGIQDRINFDNASARLLPIEQRANERLGIAKGHARTYLDDLMPRIVGTVTGIQQYYNLHNNITAAIKGTSSREDVKAMLRLLQEKTQEFGRQSNVIRVDIGKLRGLLGEDSAAFQGIGTELKGILDSDDGVLADIAKQLDGIDGKIAGVAAAVAVSGLVAVVGGIMFVVGAFGSVVTGGAATALCVAGGAVAAVGVAGAIGASVSLAGLITLKNDQLARQRTIERERTQVMAMETGFRTLAGSAARAHDSAQTMALSWDFMGNHLGELYNNLESGKTDIAAIRDIFLATADDTVKLILVDAKTIQRQMTGAPAEIDKGRNVADMLLQATNDPGPRLHRLAA